MAIPLNKIKLDSKIREDSIELDILKILLNEAAQFICDLEQRYLGHPNQLSKVIECLREQGIVEGKVKIELTTKGCERALYVLHNTV